MAIEVEYKENRVGPTNIKGAFQGRFQTQLGAKASPLGRLKVLYKTPQQGRISAGRYFSHIFYKDVELSLWYASQWDDCNAEIRQLQCATKLYYL